MTVKQLMKKLEKLPPNLKVWVDDGGYVEGATKLKKVKVIQAYKAALDGDEVDDEYRYIDEDDTQEKIQGLLKQKGYKIFKTKYDKVLSKEIVMIKGF
jgi:hypothetical protein